jgi:hypothetical protein
VDVEDYIHTYNKTSRLELPNENVQHNQLKRATKVHNNVQALLNLLSTEYGNSVVEIRDNKYKSVKHLDCYTTVDWRVRNQVGYQGIDLSSAPRPPGRVLVMRCKMQRRTYCLQ